jgi:hypothetical protein
MDNVQNCGSLISHLFVVKTHGNGKKLCTEILQIIFVDVTGIESFELMTDMKGMFGNELEQMFGILTSS